MELVNYKYTSDFPISFSEPFIEYLNSDINGALIVVKEKDIVLPLLVRKKLGFSIGYFVHAPLKNGYRLSLDEEKEFFNLLLPFLEKKEKIDFVLPPLHIENFNHIPKKSKGYKLALIYILLENKTITELFESFKPVYRRHIRNAEKENIKVKIGLEYFDDFYSIYSERLIQENASYDSYEKIKKLAYNKDSEINVQCGVAYLNDKIEAGILNISDKTNAYYIFGGSSKNAHNGSFRLLHWELIKTYKQEGLKSYRLGAYREGDMLTEKHERLASFKMGFGSKIQEGYHFTFIINPFKYRLYTILLSLKSKFNK